MELKIKDNQIVAVYLCFANEYQKNNDLAEIQGEIDDIDYTIKLINNNLFHIVFQKNNEQHGVVLPTEELEKMYKTSIRKFKIEEIFDELFN